VSKKWENVLVGVNKRNYIYLIGDEYMYNHLNVTFNINIML